MARHRRAPRIELRVQVLGLLILLALGAVVARLWWVQVARGEVYTKRLAARSQVTVRIPSVRGEIRDRNGLPLVQNRASYEVDFYLPDMVRGYQQLFGSEPRRSYRAPVSGMLKDMTEADIVQIVNTAIAPRLDDLDLAKDYNSERLQKHFRNNREVPFTYIEDIDFKTIAKFSEHDVGLPGVDISIRPVREYLYGALGAHLLGYVGAPVETDKEEAAKFNFYQPDVEGKSQIEQHLDQYLKGKPGVRIMQRSVKGVIESGGEIRDPVPGNNVYLTIDARIQFIAEQALRAVGRGAAVVVDPSNGDILAMASVPSYNPNTFIPSISADDWEVLRKDETDPLTNRAISSYAPGSTYKVVTALAGLVKGMKPGHRFGCSGGVQYGNKYMGCWVIQKKLPPHGSISVSEALKVSCNAFFYQYGNAAGIDKIGQVGKALGLGERSGIPLTGESGGILPGPEWLKLVNPNERWSNGHTANVSIGQGYVLASPLQMAMVTAAVANGGVCYQPRLVARVLDQNGKPARDETGKLLVGEQPIVRANLKDAGVTEEGLEVIRNGMWRVVNDPGGTARRAQIKGVEVAGKTGTAQFWRNGKADNHTWFISFAPYKNPKYVVCVFVQGAKSGGGVSAPIAAKILEESLALERGYSPELAALEPAKGSFKFIEQVDYTSAVPAAFGSGDEETAEHVEATAVRVTEKKREVTAPNIKPAADEAGRVRKKKRVEKAERTERAEPAPRDRRNIFKRFFGPKRDGRSAPRQDRGSAR